MTKEQSMIEQLAAKGQVHSWLTIRCLKNTAKTFTGQQNANIAVAERLIGTGTLKRANGEQRAAWLVKYNRTTARYERHLASAVARKSWKVVESLSSDLQGRTATDRDNEAEYLFVVVSK